MPLDDYDATTALTAYFPDRDERRTARLWAVEKLAHDLAAAGLVTMFEGAGTNPTTLSGYATSKLWLQASAGVTDEPGTLRAYDGSGDASLVASWPALTLAGLRRHLSVYSRDEVDDLLDALPGGGAMSSSEQPEVSDGTIDGIATSHGFGGGAFGVRWRRDNVIEITGDISLLGLDSTSDNAPYEIYLDPDTYGTIEGIDLGAATVYIRTDLATGNGYSLGANDYGQCGDGTTTTCVRPTRIQKFVDDAVKVSRFYPTQSLGSTERGAAALTTAGTVYMWGTQVNYFCGNNVSSSYLSTPRRLTLSDGSAITGATWVALATAYAPVFVGLSGNRALYHGAGTNGANGSGDTANVAYPSYLGGASTPRTDVSRIVTTGANASTARAVSILLDTTGKAEVAGARTYGIGDGSGLTTNLTAFTDLAGDIASETILEVYAGGGETPLLGARTATDWWQCGYGTSGVHADGSTSHRTSMFKPTLPSGWAGYVTAGQIAGGNGNVAIGVEATISGVKRLATIGFDSHYATAKNTTGVAAASQTFGEVLGVTSDPTGWTFRGDYNKFNLDVLSTEELRSAGANDVGQGGSQVSNRRSIRTLQPVLSAGKVRSKPITFVGEYDADTTYYRLDEVRYQGSTWELIVASSEGNAPPTLPTEANTWWRLHTRGFPETSAIVFVFRGAGTVAVQAGDTLEQPLPMTGTITGWTLVADQAGDLVIDLRKDSYSNYPPTVGDSITASDKPTLSSAAKNQSSALTGWTTSITPTDVMSAVVQSASLVTRATLTLTVTRGS